MTFGLSYKLRRARGGGLTYTGMLHLTGYGFWLLCPKRGTKFFLSVTYSGMCRLTGYGFWPLCPKQGIQFFLSVLNRLYFVSFVLCKDLK